MSGNDLFRGLNYLDSKYIDLAVSDAFSLEAFQREEEREVPGKRKKIRKAFLLAAMIALLSALVGCGIVYVLKMQDLKIGETEVVIETGVGSGGETSVKTESRHILTFSGIKGSQNYKAAQEWLEFEKTFDSDRSILKASDSHHSEFPARYEAYSIYAQEQADKLNEITEKYGLTLAGAKVNARTPRSLLAYLNIDSILLPDAQAELSNLTTEYYENGKFYADFYLLMDSGENCWPYDTFCLYYYTQKTCFDDHMVYLSETADWREWNYTTSSGEQVLILRSDSRNEAYIFLDQETATAAAKIYTEHFDEVMTDGQLQQMVDQIHFSLSPQPGDSAILDGFGSNIDATEKKQTQNGVTLELKSVTTDGEIAYITLGVTAPEGTNLTGMGIHPGNRSEGLMLPQEGYGDFSMLYANWVSQDDGDGLDNTQNLVIITEPNTQDGTAFQADSRWSLYIEGLDISEPNSMLQRDVHQQMEGVWQFTISFENGDFREVEFIREPVKMKLYAGGGERVDVQLISLKLRKYSGTAVFEDDAGDLNDYENHVYTCAVLKDGSRIELHHTGGLGNVTGFRFEGEVPLDQVEYVTLKDGTRLYPQNNPNG